jgi:hypothetical protein
VVIRALTDWMVVRRPAKDSKRMKVGDIVRWTLPAAFTTREVSPQIGVIVKMHIGNGADVAWFGDNMRIVWTPIVELKVISVS